MDIRNFCLLPLMLFGLLFFRPAEAGDAPAPAAATAVIPAQKTPAAELREAVDKNHVDDIDDLLTAHPNLLKTKIGNLPLLHYCIERKKADSFRKLLELGADPNVVDALDCTPMIFAADRLSLEFFNILFKEYPEKGQFSLHSYASDKRGRTVRNVLNSFEENENALEELAKKDKTRSVEKLAEDLEKCQGLLYDYCSNYGLASDRLLGYLPTHAQIALRHDFCGITIWRLILAGLFLFIAWTLSRIWRSATHDCVLKKSEQIHAASGGKLMVNAFRRAVNFFLIMAGLVLAVCALFPQANEYLGALLRPVACLAMIILVWDLAGLLQETLRRWASKFNMEIDKTLLALVRRIFRAVVIFYGLIYFYEKISGSSLTTLLAGLGIGGMAIAFAATDTLKNFIAFLMLLLDKPFAVGDKVAIGANEGTIENIGLRTTQLRLSDGSDALVSIPNSQTVDSAVRNFPMKPAEQFLRRADTLSLSRENSAEKVEKALAIVKNLLTASSVNVEGKTPQVFFTGLGAGLVISFTYWFAGNDNTAFQEFNEKFNFAILREFAAEGIKFA